jgi:GH35 family endo-1,4-beta-xylanase
MVKLVKQLNANGTLVDGIGVQAQLAVRLLAKGGIIAMSAHTNSLGW